MIDPKEGYRGLHFNATERGIHTEIQLRTPNQTKWTDWMHETVYKSHGTPDQKAAIRANMPSIKAYATQMSAYYAHIDSGHWSMTRPPCGDAVASSVGCL